MADALQIIDAICKSDPAIGRFYISDIAYQIGQDSARAIKKELEPILPAYYKRAGQVLKKSIGRSYVESAIAGNPRFDQDLIDAYNFVVDAYSSISKAGTDTFLNASGDTVTVYRDDKGRFASSSSKPELSESRATGHELAQQFKQVAPQPTISGKGKVKPQAIDRTTAQEKRWTVPGNLAGELAAPESEVAAGTILQAKLKPSDQAADKTAEGRMIYGLHSQAVLNTMTERFESAGILPADTDPSYNDAATGLDVDVKVENAQGKSETVRAVYDKGKQTWRLPSNMGSGWAIVDTNVTANAKNPNRDVVTERLGAISDRVGQNILFQANMTNFASQMAGQAAAAQGARGLDTPKASRAGTNLEVAGKILENLGMKNYGSMVQQAGRSLKTVSDSELRGNLTRAAYRYRGIEAPRIGQDIINAAEGPKPADSGFNESRSKYYQQVLSPGETPGDAIAMGQQRDYITLALAQRMRKRESDAGMGTAAGPIGVNYNGLAQKIAQGIGRGMPSEGVLTDSNGNVVSQSMGIAHDGFMPFNAEALGKLNGGQYVRTRQLGGFTGEDLRTLLVGNGRAGQVLSNSGVYELEFDPSVRGKNRYNDKTMQMIDTYDRILDQIANGGLYAVPLPAQNERMAHERALQRAAGNKEQYREQLKIARQEQYNSLATIDKTAIDNIRREVEPRARLEYAQRYGERVGPGGQPIVSAQMKAGENRFVEQQVDAMVKQRQAEQARALSLNSEGYALALKTLQQFYPYLIRTARYRDWNQFGAEAGDQEMNRYARLGGGRVASDKWYTDRELLRPAGGTGDIQAARRGLPKATGTLEQRVENQLKNQIVPGFKPSVAGGGGGAGGAGGGGGGGLAAAGNTHAAKVGQDLLTSSASEIAKISNLRMPDDTKMAMNDAALNNTDDTNGVRRLLSWYAQSPRDAANFLATNNGQKWAKLLSDPKVADNIANSTTTPDLEKDGARFGKDQLFEAMQDVVLASAMNAAANSPIVSPEIDSENDLPEGKGAVLVDDNGMTPRDFRTKIAGNRFIGDSKSMYQSILGNSNANHVNPYTVFDPLQSAITEYNRIVSGGGGSEDSINRLTAQGLNDAQRIDALASEGAIGTEAANTARAIAEASKADGLFGQDSEQVLNSIRNRFRLGHGSFLQEKVGARATNQDSAFDPKVTPPQGGLYKAVDRPLSPQEQAWVEETLSYVGVVL